MTSGALHGVPSLRRILYMSLRSSAVSDRVIVDEIVLPAMRRNQAAEVTGCLWFDEAAFVQAIEGTDEELGPIWSSILADHRHGAVTVCEDAAVQDRALSRFSMRVLRDVDHVELVAVASDFAALARSADGDGVTLQEWASPYGPLLLSNLMRLADEPPAETPAAG